MKKVILLIMILALVNITTIESAQYAKNKTRFSLTISSGVKMIADDLFKEIYSSTSITYSIDFSYKLNKLLVLFFHSDLQFLKGETSLTKDETSLSLIPAEIGIRLFFGKGKLMPYLGAGGGVYLFSDKMTVETETSSVSDTSFGFLGEAGLKISLTKKWFLDLKGKYLILTVHPDAPDSNITTVKRNLSGLLVIFGVGFRF